MPERSITTALQRAWKKRGDCAFIEIEVRDLREAEEAAKTCAELRQEDPNYPLLIMFDNCTPQVIRGAIDTLKRKGLYDAALFEASGGITGENIERFSGCGIDVLSLGQLTHSASAMNFAQQLR